MNKYLLSYLSVCQKSGNLVSGEFACEKSVKSRSAKLVILSFEASLNTRNKFVFKCEFYGVPVAVVDISKSQLGCVIGKDIRSVIALLDESMAKSVRALIDRES